MHAAAITSRFITGRSSEVEFADSGIVVNERSSIHNVVASCLARTVQSHEIFLDLANKLIHYAEQSFMLRNVDALQEVSSVLMNLPIDGAWQIGLYYYALAINRKGQIDKAECLLENVADNAPINYRARAIQTLGANYHTNEHQLDEALRFQLEALRLASEKTAPDLHTTLLANLKIAHLKSDWGDHKGALDVLEAISPLVRIVSLRKPLYFYFYQNELAVEFGELNRVSEAEAASAIALASPFAPSYPEWAETRQELEAKRTSATPSVVAINRTPEAIPAPRMQPRLRPQPKLIFPFCWPPRTEHYFQRSIIPIPATATNPLSAISILHRVLICIGSRAPPA